MAKMARKEIKGPASLNLVVTYDEGGTHVGLKTTGNVFFSLNDKFPIGLYIEPHQIDELVFHLLRAKRKMLKYEGNS
jgi:hypothetical protein